MYSLRDVNGAKGCVGDVDLCRSNLPGSYHGKNLVADNYITLEPF